MIGVGAEQKTDGFTLLADHDEKRVGRLMDGDGGEQGS